MAEIRLISILPVSQVTGATPPADTGGGQPTIAVNAPVGSVLSGFIINRDSAGNPILRTADADIVFASQFFLKIGSEVVIRVENRGGANQARILSVNGQPPDVAETMSAYAGEPEVIIGQPGANHSRSTASAPTDEIISRPASPALLTGSWLPAGDARSSSAASVALTVSIVSLSAKAPPGASPPAASAQSSGAPPLAVPSEALPPAASSAGASPAAASVAAAEVPPAASANPYAVYARTALASLFPSAGIAKPSPATPPGAATDGLPPAAAAPASSRSLPQPGDRITTIIARQLPGGELILQSPQGTLRLAAGAALPLGASAVLEVQKADSAAEALSSRGIWWSQEPLPDLPQLASSWPTLKQLIDLLQSRPAGAESLPLLLRASMAPFSANTPLQMTAGLLFFASALRGGDIRSWLGKDNADWLIRSGHQLLLERADAEFAVLARPYQEAPANSWQMLAFPFMAGGELQQVRLFTKRDRKPAKDDRGRQQGDTRFIIEVELSQLGEMQLDGFVREGQETLEFDLLVRSLKPLDALVQKDIFMIYQRVAETTGYRGTIQFQAVKAFAVRPLEEMNAEHLRDVVV